MRCRRCFSVHVGFPVLVLSLAIAGPEVCAEDPDPSQPGIIALQQSYPGLADSPWPMLGKDQQHSGYTDRLGPLTEPWVLWEVAPGIPDGLSWAEPTLDEDGNIYITVGQNGDPVTGPYRVAYTFSYDPAGTLRWCFGPLSTDTWRTGLSVPALNAGNGVVLGYRLGVVAYHTQSTGDLLWSTVVGSGTISSPVIADDGYIYIGGRRGPNGIYKVSPVDGSIVWSILPGPGVTGSPALSHDQSTVYCGVSAGGIHRIVAVDAFTGIEKYGFTSPQNANWGWASPSVGPDGTIYIQEGHSSTILYALTDTGSALAVKWAFDPAANTGDACRIVPVDHDTVYAISWAPDPILFALDFNGVVKWQTVFPGDHSIYQPVVTDEAVYASLDFSGQVVCVDRNTGAMLWTKQVGEPEAGMTGLVIGDDSIIYVISCDGTSSHPGENTLVALRPNSLPLADAGSDQVLEATSPSGALVSLDGSDSTDADSTPGTNDDIVLFEWILEGDVIATGETTSETLPLGVNVVTLRVTDSRGASDEDEVQITVEDTTPPEITLSVTPEMLWPPNHKMVEIVPTITVTDLCDPAPSVALKSISMDEGDETNTYDPAFDNTVGDGNTTDDIQVDADGRIFLRAERSGLGDGRVYTIIYEVTDASGNSSEASATVVVPHNL